MASRALGFGSRGSQRAAVERELREVYQLVPWGRFCLACGDELPAVPDTRAPQSPDPLPFVGREEELRWLSDIALRASYEFVFARLIGDNGVGKTRLAVQALQENRRNGRLEKAVAVALRQDQPAEPVVAKLLKTPKEVVAAAQRAAGIAATN